MPGRCGYDGWPGRAPGCCVRTGGEGSGRGPPIGACGRMLGYGGRGAPGAPGRAAIGCAGRGAPAPVWTPLPGAPPAGRAVDGIAGRSTFGATRAARRGADRGAGDVGSGGVGVDGRCSSIRRRSVGGTTRPAVGGFGGAGARGASAAGAAATGVATAGGSWTGGASTRSARSAWGGASTAVVSATGGGGASTTTGDGP